MAEAFQELEDQAVAEMEAEGNNPTTLTLAYWVDARYQGQSFELQVPRKDWLDTFHRSHEERYGYSREETPVEAVTLRVVAEAPPLPLSPTRLEEADGPPPTQVTPVYFDGNEETVRRVWRKDLRSGHTLTGPALVLEYSSTTWLPPSWRLEVDDWGSLHLTKAKE
jgi:N-methylhydantoinase A